MRILPMLRSLRPFVVTMMLLGAPTLSAAQPPKAPEGFVPVDQLAPQEELPATPLVAAAYSVAWAAVLIYLFSIWKRLAAVEREIADVAKRINSAGGR